MAGHAAAGGDDGLGGVHAVNVFRAGLDAHQNDFLTLRRTGLGFVRVKHHRARGRAGAGGQALGQHVAGIAFINGGVQQLIKLGRIDAQDGLVLADQALGDHLNGDLQRRLGGALAVAGLQHPQTALLDRELNVLHVAIMVLEIVENLAQLGEHVRHGGFHGRQMVVHLLAHGFCQALWRADARHHVLALGVDQELAVIALLAGGRVAGERDARGRGVAHIAEHHRLNVHRRAPAGGDVVHAAIGDGPVIHPGAEHRPDRAPELVAGIGGEREIKRALNGLLVLRDHLFPLFSGDFGVQIVVALFLEGLKDLLERGVRHAQHHVRIHGDETAIAVEREAAVARKLGEAFGGLVIEAQVQHRIHHARHGGAGAGTNGDQERVGGIAERLADRRLELFQRGLDLVFQIGRIGVVVFVIGGADVGGDGEARRNRQAQLGHFREIGTLATEKLAHVGLAFRVPSTEGVNPFGLCVHDVVGS